MAIPRWDTTSLTSTTVTPATTEALPSFTEMSAHADTVLEAAPRARVWSSHTA